MFKCARPGCSTPSKFKSSSCAREHYCSGTCQRLYWQIHKSMCSTLKKLLNKEQPFREVIRIIEETVWSKLGNFSRIINQLILCAEYQFGKEVSGIRYRERADGERVDNWIVDIENLHQSLGWFIFAE